MRREPSFLPSCERRATPLRIILPLSREERCERLDNIRVMYGKSPMVGVMCARWSTRSSIRSLGKWCTSGCPFLTVLCRKSSFIGLFPRVRPSNLLTFLIFPGGVSVQKGETGISVQTVLRKRHRRRAMMPSGYLFFNGVFTLPSPSFLLLFSSSGTYERRLSAQFCTKLHI